MRSAVSRFPRGRHYALTWGIPDNYGGMTSAMLHRTRAFVALGGVSVDVLTLDDRPDYAAVEERLRAAGELIDGMRLRNLWDELRVKPPSAQRDPISPAAPLEPADGDRVVRDGDVVLLRERTDADGRFVAADRFRRDGTLLATDRSVDGRRVVIVHGEDGEPLRRWGSTWKLYRWWLDRMITRMPSYLLVDSKTAARFVATYRRDHVVTVHIVHGGHRRGDAAGTLRASREYALRRAADFDLVVVLTARQRADLVADGLAGGARVRVIPNGVPLDATAHTRHARGQGVVVASLTGRKRIELAVEAAARAGRERAGIRLDVYGEGPREEAIRARVCADGAEERIRLHGFLPDARARFAEADFSLLTSTSEGLPLVLAEAMAAGCLPIAYDIRYGPADLIKDGVNGFLVEDGDVDAMADRIVHLQRLPEAKVAAMRRRARDRALAFSDEAVTRAWARELGAARDAKHLADAKEKGALVRARRVLGVVRRRLRALRAG
ncbi:glycosyltransferase [Streptomyces sp. MS2A]|nr:glycosyltransferase [Streptomyces sp. MS2A]